MRGGQYLWGASIHIEGGGQHLWGWGSIHIEGGVFQLKPDFLDLIFGQIQTENQLTTLALFALSVTTINHFIILGEEFKASTIKAPDSQSGSASGSASDSASGLGSAASRAHRCERWCFLNWLFPHIQDWRHHSLGIVGVRHNNNFHFRYPMWNMRRHHRNFHNAFL